MSRLLKGECVRMDAAGFVYNTQAGTRPEPNPEPDAPPARQEWEDAARKARAIVDGANRYMVKMQAQTQRQAREALETAREEGFQKGFEEGRSQALLENEQTLARITGLLQQIDRDREALLMQYERGMVDLALDIARKVVDDKLSEDDRAFVNIFRRAVEGLHVKKAVRLQISGHEAQFATANSDYLLSLSGGAQSLDIQVLEDAAPGTCILETDDELIDASAQRQLETLTQAVEAIR